MRAMYHLELLVLRSIQFLDGGLTLPFLNTLNLPAAGNKNKNRITYKNTRKRSNLSVAVQQSSSILVQASEDGNSPGSKQISESCTTHLLLGQDNTVGIIGGISVFSTLIFLEKLVWWSSRHGKEKCFPFIVCNDPELNSEIPCQNSLPSLKRKSSKIQSNPDKIVDNLRQKMAFLEQSGARCIVMPCHFSHALHDQIFEGCSVHFLHIGECVAKEIKEANFKPLAGGSNVRVGVLATYETLRAGFYQEKLQDQGFEVVLPDKSTMENIVDPAFKALKRKDMEGARNLLRIAIQVLLVRAVNRVILASDEMRCILPPGDPLLMKCIDPVDALARSTIKWAQSAKKVQEKT